MKQPFLAVAFITFIFLAGIHTSAYSQMERERADIDKPITETFWSTHFIGMANTQQLEKGNLNATILHNFGIATNEPFKNFFGFDASPNVRFGADYGITDRWQIGVGRTTENKVYDFRTKIAILQQNESDNMPVNIGVKGDIGIKTIEDGSSFDERLSYFASLMFSRKFNNRVSLQVAPMYSYFNSVRVGESKDHFAIGLGGEVKITDQIALIAEYFPVIGERSDNTTNAFGFGMNVETGGHVFQIFIESSRWHTEQHIVARNTDKFFAGDFRIGFNINRIFWLDKKR